MGEYQYGGSFYLFWEAKMWEHLLEEFGSFIQSFDLQIKAYKGYNGVHNDPYIFSLKLCVAEVVLVPEAKCLKSEIH